MKFRRWGKNWSVGVEREKVFFVGGGGGWKKKSFSSSVVGDKGRKKGLLVVRSCGCWGGRMERRKGGWKYLVQVKLAERLLCFFLSHREEEVGGGEGKRGLVGCSL